MEEITLEAQNLFRKDLDLSSFRQGLVLYHFVTFG